MINLFSFVEGGLRAPTIYEYTRSHARLIVLQCELSSHHKFEDAFDQLVLLFSYFAMSILYQTRD